MQLNRGISLAVYLSLFCGTGLLAVAQDDQDSRYGLKPGPTPTRKNLDSDNVFLGPKKSDASAAKGGSGSGTVQLKPFRTAGKKPSPRPMPTASPRPKTSPSPTPHAKATPSLSPKLKPSATPKAAPTTTPKTASKSTPSPETETETPTPKPVAASEKPPFASPVPGRKGYVTSPFSPGAGFIDVTGLEPGSEAKDPYSGKVFRVP